MIPTQMILSIYFQFGLLCALPWLFNWAAHGSMPVTTRLIAFIVFSGTLISCGDILWTVHDEMPGRFGDALTLVFPMMLFCIAGLGWVVKSLVEMVKKSMPENEE